MTKKKKEICKTLIPFGDGYYAVCRLYKGTLVNNKPVFKIVSVDEAGCFTREQWNQLSTRIKIWKDKRKESNPNKDWR